MNTPQTTTNQIHAISEQDLDAVSGGFQVYTGGGGGTMAHGRVIPSRPNGNDIIAGFLITTFLGLAFL